MSKKNLTLISELLDTERERMVILADDEDLWWTPADLQEIEKKQLDLVKTIVDRMGGPNV